MGEEFRYWLLSWASTDSPWIHTLWKDTEHGVAIYVTTEEHVYG